MTEHWFLATMLALVALECAVACYLGYKVYRISERAEAIGAATYLEVRKLLDQSR